jgi:uncharacterized protein
MDMVKIVNVTRDTVLGEQIEVAETSCTRMVGLLGRSGLEPGAGLLIVPSQAVHTIGMRFAIDVIFINRDRRVLHLQPAMPPYRLTGVHWRARYVLELPSGMIAETSTQVGDQLSLHE